MRNMKVTSFHTIFSFDVQLARGFRVLHRFPKTWYKVASCVTEHSTYESGLTNIYWSKNTHKFYMVRFFDGCFSEMYAETIGVDWADLNKKAEDVLKSFNADFQALRTSYKNNKITREELEAKRLDLIHKHQATKLV